MNVHWIDLEWMHYTGSHPRFEQSLEEIQKLPSGDTVFLTMIFEYPPAAIWAPTLSRWLSRAKKYGPSLVLIIDPWYLESVENLDVDIVVPFNRYLASMCFRTLDAEESLVAGSWSPDNEKFLFLTGKPNKPNRIRLLYKLHQAGLLDHCVWSLFVPELFLDQCYDLLPEIYSQEVRQFVGLHSRNPDSIDPMINGRTLHYSGIPFSTDLYQNSSFQLISESTWALRPDIYTSEKTWLSMLNRRPFIMAAAPGTLRYLRNMGFCTFERYLPVPDYDDIIDSEARLSAIVENVRYWINHIADHEANIRDDVEYNYQHLLTINQHQCQNLLDILGKQGWTGQFKDLDFLRDPLQESQFRNWYNRIRGPLWPDCNNEKDFFLLPKFIQDECIKVFGYQPKEKP